MEVHTHTHPAPTGHRKKWTHYFWEFLMLFLAVFCGFLAENQREHMVEHQREKKYMQTLLEDLVNDTLDLSADIARWERIIQRTDSLRTELGKPPEARDHKRVYILARAVNFDNNFLYHDRTIGQLKNAGNFRLIRNKNIADTLVDYDAVYRTSIYPIEEIFRNIQRPEHLALQDQLLSSKFYDITEDPALFDSAAKKEPEVIMIRKGKEDLVFQYYNRLYNNKRLNRNRVRWLKNMLEKARYLIGMIKKEYHLE